MYFLTLFFNFFYQWTERSSCSLYSHSTIESVESQRLWLWFRTPSAFLLCLMLPCSPASNVVSGLPDYNICRLAAPPPQKVSAASYTTATHTRALHTTWRLSACFKIMQHISCHRHARLQTTCRYFCLSGRAASVPGMKEFSWEQPFRGTADLTSQKDQWRDLIFTFKDADLHAVSVITADLC